MKKKKEKQRDPIDVRLCDFDDVNYHVTIDAAARNILRVSMSAPCWRDIETKGGADAVKKYYDGLAVDPEAGFDVTLQIDLENLPCKEDELVQKIQMLKHNVIGGVFDNYFTALLNGKPIAENYKFDLRGDTSVYFIPRNDRVTIVYELNFTDAVDLAIARIFMQEFVDYRKKLGAAPPCTFGQNPPLELKEFGITEPTQKLGYVSFAVMKGHLEAGRKDKVVSVLQVFRNYVQYHTTCAKAYFHSRMRARCAAMLKILNRAKIETEQREKKTMGGKTFIRQ